jgi:ABC-type nickel/cobalt efflux system permease component RcnA
VRTVGAFSVGLAITAFGFGFRHGIDWDHIAALTDITGSQEESRRSMVLATMYALGHALVVFVLGVAAIVAAERLPASVDGVMERVVGATLVLLGLYVIISLVRHGRDFRMRSRWMLVFSGVRRAVRWVRGRRDAPVVVIDHEHAHDPAEPHPDADRVDALAGAGHSLPVEHRHAHRHIATVPDDPFMNYGKPTAFGVGMIHGVGAETPTQVLLLLAAAGAGGTTEGLVLLCCFLVGLLTSNSLIAAAGTFGFLGASRNWPLYLGVSVVTAVFSLVIGTVFLTGNATFLPAFFGG